MGIITTLIRANHEKKYADLQNELGGYKAIVTLGQMAPEMVKPETMEWAMDNIAHLADGGRPGSRPKGGDNPFKTILKGITGGLSNLNPSPKAPEAVGERPQQLLRTDPEQQEYIKRQSEIQARLKGDEATQAERGRNKADLEFNQQNFEQQQKQSDEQLKTALAKIEELPVSTDEKQRMAQEATAKRYSFSLGPKRINSIPGSALAGRTDRYGNPTDPKLDYTDDGGVLTPQEPKGAHAPSVAQEKYKNAIAAYAQKHNLSVENMTPAQIQEATSTGSELKGMLGNLAEAQTIIDNPASYTPSQVQAAKDFKRNEASKAQGVNIRNEIGAETVRESKELKALSGEGPQGAEAIAIRKKAAEDTSLDLEAWDYLATGNLRVRGLGRSSGARVAQIQMRAKQIREEMGLAPAEVIAMRADLKGNTAALAKITQTGAQIEQFEGTLQRNLDVASRLSAAYKRSDIPFVNRIVGAFKTGKGDSEALNLAAQLHGVSREWAKIMAGSTSAAGVPISEAAQADELMSAAMSKGQLDSLFKDVIQVDARNRTAAINATRSGLLDRIKGISSKPSETPAATPQSTAAPHKIKIGNKFYIYKGTGDTADMASYTEVK